MNSSKKETLTLQAKSILFISLCLLVALLNFRLLKQLLEFSLNNEFASIIPIIPVLCGILIFKNRSIIFTQCRSSKISTGIGIVLGVPSLIWLVAESSSRPDNVDTLSIRAFVFVVVIICVFIACYGIAVFRSALFPVLMLFLMVPIPNALLQHMIAALQQGSAEGSAILFKLTGTPFFRDGTLFTLPGINIEIASECSSIRSSLALLYSSLLASYLFLKSPGRRLALILIAIPLSMLKNSIRIVTISLLAIHIDTRFLTESSLHQQGGIVFFILALFLLLPALLWLRKSEGRSLQKTRKAREIPE